MERSIERAYKRQCFQGRGWTARWLDRIFFSALCGFSLYIYGGGLLLSLSFMGASMALLIVLEIRRWDRFKRKLWQTRLDQLKLEDWLRTESERIRQAGETVLFPTPGRDALLGHCLNCGSGTTFHCFGEPEKELETEASSMGCRIEFHPWGQGTEPSREQVIERIRQDAPKHDNKRWRVLMHIPGSRYLLTGFLLLAFSILFRKAIYWRLLGSICLLIGTIRRTFHMFEKT